ncbi:hypothetical protein MRBLRC7O_000892 [Agrobacterium radiobacter]|uniref:hypothetical protein n=1 Tax=Agrobacterium radiobacter TaxID=362 RepID=UPI0034665AC4
MTWSTNITEAKTGDYVWLALPDGRVIKSWWARGYFVDADLMYPPIAWQPFVKPIHPFASAKTSGDALTKAPMNVSLPDTDERSGEGANAGGLNDREVKTQNLEHAVEFVSSSTAPELAKQEESAS